MQAALVEGRSPAQEDAVEAEPSSSPLLDVKGFTALELFRKDDREAGAKPGPKPSLLGDPRDCMVYAFHSVFRSIIRTFQTFLPSS